MKKWSHDLLFGAILCVLVLVTVSSSVWADNFTWTQRTTPVGAIWQAVAASSDCQKIAIGGENTYIYTSSNGGISWTQRTGSGIKNWYGLASTADGNMLAAATYSGYIYTSTDGGANWTKQMGSDSLSWRSIASSSDGSMLVATSSYIYASTDSGVTWTPLTSAGSKTWKGIAISPDGAKIAAAAAGDYVYTSSDGGTTWMLRSAVGSQGWMPLDASSDIKTIIVGAWGGYVKSTSDSGNTWTQHDTLGSAFWWGAACSADGNVMGMAQTSPSGYVWTTTDGGSTWAAESSAGSRTWWDVVSSSDGTRLVVSYSGYVYTGTTSPSAPTVTTDSITSVTTTTAAGGGSVTYDGGATITAAGICWSSSENPTVADSHTVDDVGTGEFTSSLTSLSPNTAYYVRAYAINSVDTGYGVQRSFATLPTFTVSGYVTLPAKSVDGIDSVLMDGLPGDPLTDSTGYYIATVDSGWSGVVRPTKAGYTFDPDSIVFSNVSENQNASYSGTLLTYTISGHVALAAKTAVGIDSVTMNGLPGDPLTDSTGYYTATVDYGWSGVVKPAKDCYVFDPESTSYSSVTTNQVTDYTGTFLTYTVSGHVWTSDSTGIDSVTMSGLPGDPLTDSTGYYTATVDCGWSGVVTPAKDGYTFDPESTSYSNVTDNQEADYIGTLLTYTISGFVHRSLKTGVNPGIKDVIMNGLPGNPLTDSSGYYIARVDYGWSGVVTPEKNCYVIAPESTIYSNVTQNQVTSYAGALTTYTISGHVLTSDSAGIDSVTMSGLPGDPSTDSTGYYTATVNCGWTGVVTPAKYGYTFAPESTSYSSVTDDQETDYLGTYLTYTISGYVRDTDSLGVEGVVLSGLPGDPETDTGGYYSAVVPYGWSGRVTPTDTCVFDPEYRDYDSVISDQSYQSYVEDCFSQGVDEDKDNLVPREYQLSQNHPNPFNPETEIAFGLPKAGFVTLKVYNILGQEVTALVDRNMSAGRYRVTWNGTDRSGRVVSSGVYFYRMQSEDFVQTRRMLLLK
jgi:hypothetical protein